MLNYNLLEAQSGYYAKVFSEAKPYNYIVIDGILEQEIATTAFQKFPKMEEMDRLKDFRQYKSQDPVIDKFHPIFGEIIFQHLHSQRFLKILSKITGISDLIADNQLYAGGLAQGGSGSFLNVHIDNSSHPVTNYYRRLNLLLYLNKDWTEQKGGHLEFWSPDLSQSVAILPSFNRAVIFVTDKQSWHSYRRVKTPDGDTRKSLNIYYFTKQSPDCTDYYHITSFRARKNEILNKALYPLDNIIRTVVRKIRQNKDGHAVLFAQNKKNEEV
jgi:Rps23 Pro-64 3,4-dihydroxylase Tpa1-like proline 4-hydroxylase